MNKSLDVGIKDSAFKKLNAGLGNLVKKVDVRDAYDELYAMPKRKKVKFYTIYTHRDYANAKLSSYTRMLFEIFDEKVKNIPSEDNQKRKVGRILAAMYEEYIGDSLLSNEDMYATFWDIFFLSKKTWELFTPETQRIFTTIAKYLVSALIIYTGCNKDCASILLSSVIMKSDTDLVEQLAEEVFV